MQADGYVLDFTAPVFGESLIGAGSIHRIQRKMFQKPLASMSEAHDDLSREGDFYVLPNPKLTSEFMEKLANSPAMGDLEGICMGWFKKPPKSIPGKLKMVNDLGEIVTIALSSIKVTGAW